MTRSTSRGRRAAFVSIALALPFLILAGVEGALRILRIGEPPSLFMTSPHSPDYSLARPDIVKRYFPNAGGRPAVTMEASLFLADKPAGGLRLFVQGGSTAAGYPYGLGAGIAGMLEQRLRRALPGRHVEVVNTAMSAVNSYALLDFAREIIAEQPDAVLIYAGHNEYLGLLGVGSRFSVSASPATTRAIMALDQIRITRVLRGLLASQSNPTPASRTFMGSVARERRIAHDSDAFKQGLRQFEHNMGKLLAIYAKHRVPVILASIASNLRHRPPFSSQPMPAQARDFKGAQSLARLKVLANASDSADLSFRVARMLDASDAPDEALAFYQRSLQHDELRFRAPLEINAIIRRLAKGQGVTLADAEAALARASPQGIIGESLMLEHVHPNVQGYFLIADSFYQALEGTGLFEPPVIRIGIEQAWKERPVIEAEEFAGFAKIVHLKSDFPFAKTPQPVKLPRPANRHQAVGLAYFKGELSWLEMMQGSMNAYLQDGDLWNASRAQEIIASALPFDARQRRLAAQLMTDAGRAVPVQLRGHDT